MLDQEKLKYPIGRFEKPKVIDEALLATWIRSLELLPAKLAELMDNISSGDLDKVYRKDGWSVRQIIHHLPDSHMNGYIRIKWTLTEDIPTIKPYNEAAWSVLPDVGLEDVKTSLHLLKSIHKRLVTLLKNLAKDDFKRTYFHPDNNEYISIAEWTGLYAWHGEHHLAHIKIALKS